MSTLRRSGMPVFKSLLLAFFLLLAQQAAQLHALGHVQDETLRAHKSQPASHPLEQCVAFHAIDSALTATAALQDFDFPQTERASWYVSIAQPATCYRLPARAPPQAV